MDDPTVYFRPGCPFGIRLRTALRIHRVPFTRCGSGTTKKARRESVR